MNEKLEKFNKELEGKKVLVLGLGVSNLPLIDYLYEKKALVSVSDIKTIDEIDEKIIDKIKKYNINYTFGKNYMENINGFDIIFRSPSILPTNKYLEKEMDRGCLVTTEIELLINLIDAKVIGVTGSDGKTTTTTLISECLKANGYNVFIGGNIGIPLFTKASDITKDDIVVLELSSFQLMNMKISPNISIITNITPNHLNVHANMQEYIDSKKEIINYQSKDDLAVLNFDNEITRKMIDKVKGNVRTFSSKKLVNDGYIYKDDAIYECINNNLLKIIDVCDIALRGKHNYENICTVLCAIKDLTNMEKNISVLKNFNGVEHRLELVREINGIKWYNDSVSSSPTRTIAGLNSYNEKIVLIAGGYDKNIDYDVIGDHIVNKVSSLILMGDTKEKIYNATIKAEERSNKTINKYMVDSLSDAVSKAYEVAKDKEIVLFSPASASFDMFKNFADRGEKFKDFVNKL